MRRVLKTIAAGTVLAAGVLAWTIVLYAAASYPSSVKTFATRTNGQTISPSWFNDLQDEVAAIEGGLLNGFAHVLKPSSNGGQDLGTSGIHWATLYINAINLNGATMATPVTPIGPCGLSLTLTTGVYPTITDVTGATNVYVTPVMGGQCAFYDGSTAWTLLTNSEVTVALGTLTSGLPYDIFCYNNSGTIACDAPVAWTSVSARATALTKQNGVYVKTGATTRRYLGTFYTTSTTTTEDSLAKGFVWSYYNRFPRAHQGPTETTDTWNYSSATIRQANGNTANQFEIVVGVAEVMVAVDVLASVTAGGAADFAKVGIGEDATNAFAAGSFRSISQTGTITSIHSSLRKYPAAGYHKYTWEEQSDTTGTTAFYGDNTGVLQSGISGWLGS